MNIVKLRDINFSRLKKSRVQGSKSTIYFHNNKCIKIYKNMTRYQIGQCYRLYNELDGFRHSKVLFPESLIMDDRKLVGTISNGVRSKQISYVFENEKFNLDYGHLFSIMKDIVSVVKDLHKEGIIISDFSFENVLVTPNNQIYFCDTDSYSYKNISSDMVSVLLGSYLNEYRNESVFISKNSDKLSLILSLLQTIYFIFPSAITSSYYKMYSKNIKTLRNLEPIFHKIKDKRNRFGNIVYLDQYIDTSDSGIIYRDKQMRYIDKKINRR